MAANLDEVTTIILPFPPIFSFVVSLKVSTIILAFWLILYGCNCWKFFITFEALLAGTSGLSGVELAISKQQ